MHFWTPDNLRAACNGTWLVRPAPPALPLGRPADLPPPAPAPIAGLSTDTRDIRPGQAFLALRGENHDAHRFLADAVAAGATLLIIDDPSAIPHGGFAQPVAVINVPHTGKALLRLAAAYRNTLSTTRVIAVCGSNGKTTTTRLIEQVLATTLRGTASAKSFNNAVGVPLTILRAQPGDKFLLCEVGTNAPGEIATLAEVVQPDIAVITSIGREHLEGLGDLAGVAREEAAVLKFLRPKGCAIVTADAPELAEHIRAHAPASEGGVVRFGRAPDADLRLTGVRTIDDEASVGIEFTVNGRLTVRLPMLGAHNALNALAALAVARRMGIAESAAVSALASAPSAPMRLELARVALPGGGSLRVLNDAYNANPDSMAAAVATLADLAPGPGGRRVAILGDMFELGPGAAALHEGVLRALADLGSGGAVQLAILVGQRMADAAERAGGLRDAGWDDDRLLVLPDGDDAACRAAAAAVRDGDVVLLKGSRRMRLERVLAALQARAPAVADATA